MLELFKATNNFVWGPPLLLLLVGTGVYFTIRLGLFQLSKLPTAFRLIFSSDQSGQGDVSSFAALCTALAATVGTGNIVGVATAITTGGPGALFWMWVAAFFGMATKYAEGFLAIKYRTRDADGHAAGGPMHYITIGMGQKWKPLAIFFAISGVLARSPLAISFNLATETFLLFEISAVTEFQTEFNNSEICSLLASLILLSKKGSTALLYFPCRITSILTPVLS